MLQVAVMKIAAKVRTKPLVQCGEDQNLFDFLLLFMTWIIFLKANLLDIKHQFIKTISWAEMRAHDIFWFAKKVDASKKC